MLLHLETNLGLKESRGEPKDVLALFLLEVDSWVFIGILLPSPCYVGVYDSGHQEEICLPELLVRGR